MFFKHKPHIGGTDALPDCREALGETWNVQLTKPGVFSYISGATSTSINSGGPLFKDFLPKTPWRNLE